MTTVVDNTIETTPPEAKANGAQANGAKVRAPKGLPSASSDAIVRRRAATKELEAELGNLEARKTEILAELGAGVGKLETTTMRHLAASDTAAIAKLNKDASRKPSASKKARAKRATGEEAMAAQDAVMTVLKNCGGQIPASDIVHRSELDKAVVARALKALKASSKIEQAGKAKAAKYSIA